MSDISVMYQDVWHQCDVSGCLTLVWCIRMSDISVMYQDVWHQCDVSGCLTSVWCIRMSDISVMYQDVWHQCDVSGCLTSVWCVRMSDISVMCQDVWHQCDVSGCLTSVWCIRMSDISVMYQEVWHQCDVSGCLTSTVSYVFQNGQKLTAKKKNHRDRPVNFLGSWESVCIFKSQCVLNSSTCNSFLCVRCLFICFCVCYACLSDYSCWVKDKPLTLEQSMMRWSSFRSK